MRKRGQRKSSKNFSYFQARDDSHLVFLRSNLLESFRAGESSAFTDTDTEILEQYQYLLVLGE